jgi:hypothetical protein
MHPRSNIIRFYKPKVKHNQSPIEKEIANQLVAYTPVQVNLVYTTNASAQKTLPVL